MNLGKRTCWTILCGLPLVFAGCSGGTTSTTGSVQSAAQDLTTDPAGMTTVITFSQAPGAVTAGNFSASGSQTASSVVVSGTAATVVWSDRVTPSHTVTVTDAPGITNGSTAVTTSDGSAPTFTITDTAMVAGLGGDTLEVTFDGPRVVETDAEDPTSWTLTVNSTALDLTGSTFVLDNTSQVLEITLGVNASLHSSFTLAASSLTSVADVALATSAIAGTASGDSSAPSLTSVVQNLTQDEFGRVVDFTFDEAMDPTFSEVVTNFAVPNPNIATTVDQPSAGLLRVTFASPVVPGVHQVTLSNMMDTHGNAGPSGAQVVTQPSPVVNAFDSSAAVTVTNTGGDYVQSTFVQGFLESTGEDIANWTLVVDGNTIDLSLQTLTYTLSTKTLRIDLAFDMDNGTAWSLTAAGVTDVDGQAFALADAGTVSGDTTVPTATSVVQNRTQDPTGMTLDVTFSEDVDTTEAETTGNWAVTGLTVDSATVLGTPNVVRVVLTGGAAVPGTATLDVDSVEDLAGNVMAPVVGMAITSTDTTAPTITTATATAPAGANNDIVTVWFDDDMVASEVENPANWTIESPIGTGLTEAGSSITYSAAQRSARFAFDAGNDMFFKGGDSFLVSLATMTDIADNAVSTNPITGMVSAETERPYADAAWADGAINTDIVVRFSEHMDYLDDLYDAGTNVDGTRYVVRDNGGVLRGLPASAVVLNNGLGVRLTFGFVINASDTIDVMGATDLAGNYMFPNLLMPLAVEDTDDPELSLPGSPLLAVSGERNDVITLTFDRNISPWGVNAFANYIIETDGNALDLSGADFAFDGDDTITVTLDNVTAPSLQAASAYDFSVDNLQSEQGVTMSGVKTALGEAVAGDTVTPPTVGATDVEISNSNANVLLVFADEALDRTMSEDETRWDYNAGTAPALAELIDPATVRLTFAAPPVAGNTLDYNVVDLAGNAGGSVSRTVQIAETSAPLLVSVAGTAVAGVGGDYLTVVFDEPVDPNTGLTETNYTVTNGGSSVALSSANSWYDSITNSVNFYLGSGVEFDSSQAINVTVASIADHSGNVMGAPVGLGGVVGGDTTTPPGVLGAFTNYREHASGYEVDVLFDEAPDETFISDALNWTTTGGSAETVFAVDRVAEDHYRVTLSGALGAGEELEIATGLPDLAGNAAVAAIAVTVTE